jgi:hypothetical protein
MYQYANAIDIFGEMLASWISVPLRDISRIRQEGSQRVGTSTSSTWRVAGRSPVRRRGGIRPWPPPVNRHTRPSTPSSGRRCRIDEAQGGVEADGTCLALASLKGWPLRNSKCPSRGSLAGTGRANRASGLAASELGGAERPIDRGEKRPSIVRPARCPNLRKCVGPGRTDRAPFGTLHRCGGGACPALLPGPRQEPRPGQAQGGIAWTRLPHPRQRLRSRRMKSMEPSTASRPSTTIVWNANMHEHGARMSEDVPAGAPCTARAHTGTAPSVVAPKFLRYAPRHWPPCAPGGCGRRWRGRVRRPQGVVSRGRQKARGARRGSGRPPSFRLAGTARAAACVEHASRRAPAARLGLPSAGSAWQVCGAERRERRAAWGTWASRTDNGLAASRSMD